jgi:bifunctional non-homologous end joining protein LigD
MTTKLNEYKEKRDFNKTLEPAGKVDQTEEGLRYVIQHHTARKDHYDFRL